MIARLVIRIGLPALAAVVVAATSWPSPAAQAAGTTTVDLSLAPELHIDSSGCVDFSAPVNRIDAAVSAGTCRITFGTNNGSAGASLSAVDANPTNPGGATNGATTIPWTSIAGAATLPDGSIGFGLTTNFASTSLPAGQWYGLPTSAGAPLELASVTSAGLDGDVVLEFGIDPSTATPPGSYTLGPVSFTVAAL